jgi:amino acid transporter
VEPVAPAGRAEPLLRQLSVVGIWLLVVNGMIGAGIFGVPADVARLAGAYSPLVFVLCGLLIAPVMLSFAEVASYFRGTGGPMLYVRTAFGAHAGFQAGWVFYVARITAAAANINLLVSSAAYFWAGLGQGGPRMLLLLGICVGLAWVNVVGARQAMRSLGTLTVLKFLPLLMLIAIGAWQLLALDSRPATLSAPGSAGFGTAMLIAIYAFVGFESALVPAGEAKSPARDMPRAWFWGLAVVTALYVLLQYISIALLPGLEGTDRPLVDVAAVLMGPVGAMLMMGGVVASVGGNIAGSMFSTPRISYALARDGLLPAWLGHVHERHRTPDHSVIFYATLMFVLAVLGSFVWLAAMSVVARLFIYLTCIGAVPRLRREFGDAQDALRAPGGYLVPVLAALACLILLAQVRLQGLLVMAALMALGALLYYSHSRRAGKAA